LPEIEQIISERTLSCYSAIFVARAELLAGIQGRVESLNNHYMIPLPAPDGRGEARAKGANQESNKCPQQ
jgi:hypothetical protein